MSSARSATGLMPARTSSSSGFEVHPAQISVATAKIGHIGEDLSAALAQLIKVMADLGNVWGDDDLGRGFFNGIGKAPGFRALRDALVSAAQAAADLLEGTGDRGTRMAAIYQDADGQAPESPPGQTSTGRLLAPPANSGLVEDDPQPGWAMWLLDELEKLVAGCNWPRGQANGMAELAARLDRFASAVLDAKNGVKGQAATVTTVNSGAAMDAFGGYVTELSQGLDQLEEQGTELAAHCRLMASEIKAAKDQFRIGLGILAGVWAAAQGLALVTFGGSEEAALADTEVEGLTLRRMLDAALDRVGAAADTLARRPALKGALTGAVFSGGQNLAGQVAADMNGLHSGINLTSLAEASGIGFVAGGAIGINQAGLVSLAAADAGVTSRVATTLSDSVLGRIGVGAVNGILANTTMDAALHGKVDFGRDAADGLLMSGYGEAFHNIGQPEDVDIQTPAMTAKFAASPVYKKVTEPLDIEIAEYIQPIKTDLADGTPETGNIAYPGDGIVTNPGGERFVIRAADLAVRYESLGGGKFRPIGTGRAFTQPRRGSVRILAPWGQKMKGGRGSFFMAAIDPSKPGEVGTNRYIVGKTEFANTYQMAKPAPQPAGPAPDTGQ